MVYSTSQRSCVGPSLETNLVKAAEMASKQRKVADEFSATFDNETIQKWKAMAEKWQGDHSHPNPYVSNERGTFSRRDSVAKSHHYLPASKLSEIRLRLAEGEATDAEHGHHAPHKVSAPVFVRMGLELEEQQ